MRSSTHRATASGSTASSGTSSSEWASKRCRIGVISRSYLRMTLVMSRSVVAENRRRIRASLDWNSNDASRVDGMSRGVTWTRSPNFFTKTSNRGRQISLSWSNTWPRRLSFFCRSSYACTCSVWAFLYFSSIAENSASIRPTRLLVSGITGLPFLDGSWATRSRPWVHPWGIPGHERRLTTGAKPLPLQRRANVGVAPKNCLDRRQQVRGGGALEHDPGNACLQELARQRRLVVDAQDDDPQGGVTALQLPRDVRPFRHRQRQVHDDQVGLEACDRFDQGAFVRDHDHRLEHGFQEAVDAPQHVQVAVRQEYATRLHGQATPRGSCSRISAGRGPIWSTQRR